MKSSPVEHLAQYDCVLIVTDHSSYDYAKVVNEAQLVIDARNATKGINDARIVRC
jgi:UDP-N-acetyl-D-glucosamine dehydrogenase